MCESGLSIFSNFSTLSAVPHPKTQMFGSQIYNFIFFLKKMNDFPKQLSIVAFRNVTRTGANSESVEDRIVDVELTQNEVQCSCSL